MLRIEWLSIERFPPTTTNFTSKMTTSTTVICQTLGQATPLIAFWRLLHMSLVSAPSETRKFGVELHVCHVQPKVDASPFDRTNECCIQIDTGRIVLAGCTDYFPDAERIECSPGTYHVLVGYKGLNTISDDGLDGNDSYHIFLWPITN